jgi:hypothetical protein
MYTNTYGWTVFRNIPAICYEVANNEFYFGTEDGRVCLGFSGFFDEVPYGDTVGEGITGIIQPSYSYFGVTGANKQFLMARPTFQATDVPSIICDMLADYKDRPVTGSVPVTDSDSALWDVAEWDDAVWGGSLNVYDDWYSVQALGYVGSLYLTTTSVGDTFLASYDVMFEVGGPM